MNYSTGTPTVDDLLQLSITCLRRLGFIEPGAVRSGRVQWTRGTRTVAEIAVKIDTARDEPAAVFVYSADGVPVSYAVRLRFVPSNLNRGGYYLFVCPETGRTCRKLYLRGGRFVSRFAVGYLYASQLKPRTAKTGVLGYIMAANRTEQAIKAPRRKWHYRGKPTPYALRVERQARRVGSWGERLTQVERATANLAADVNRLRKSE